MKLAQTTNNFKSNIENVQSQNFGIGDASVVIEILRNRLYKNKIQTLVQEYICNGRDAMREIDSKESIKITCPTRFDYTFKVRDYGPGITPDRMSTVFVNYGSSTKRSNNKQTGGFGIGAKSAWSYTDSFTIITYVNGIKRTYVAHTGVNNNGQLDLISTKDTSEKNGTEINIAVNKNDISKFNNAIRRCVYFWKKDTYNISGENFNTHTKGVMFNKFLELNVNNTTYNNDIICTIDDIQYTLTSFLEKIPSLKELKSLVNGNFIIHIPNGLVEVSASREEISDSEHTIKYLTRLLDQTCKEIKDSVNNHFKNIKNTYDYIDKFNKYQGKFNLEKFSIYGDYKLKLKWREKTAIGLTSKLFEEVKFYKVYLDTKGRFKKVCVNNDKRTSGLSFDIHLEQKDRLFFNKSESNLMVGKRLRKYLETHMDCILIENLANNKSFDKVINDLNFKDLTTIALPVNIKNTKTNRPVKQFCLHLYNSYIRNNIYTSVDSNDKEWYYIELEGNSLPQEYCKDSIQALEKFFNIRICGLSSSAIKTIKNDKNFKPLKTLINEFKPKKEHIIDVINGKKQNVKYYNFVLKAHNISDKKFVELNNLYTNLYTNYSAKESVYLPEKLRKKIEESQEVKDFIKKDKILSEYFAKFSLLSYSHNLDKNIEDFVLYINAKSKVLKKEGK